MTKRLVIILLFVGAFSLALAATLWEVQTTFDVTLVTEEIVFTTDTLSNNIWPFKDAEVLTPGDENWRAFSDAVKLGDSARVQIRRMATGPIHVYMESQYYNQDSVIIGEIYYESDGTSEALYSGTAFRINNLLARADSGETIVLPVRGTIVSSEPVSLETEQKLPLLRSGTIALLGETMIGDEVFTAGKLELSPGDQFVVGNPETPAIGFVVANERPALQATYRVLARAARVVRPGAGDEHGYRVATRIRTRLMNDPVVIAFWLTFIAVVGGLGKFMPNQDQEAGKNTGIQWRHMEYKRKRSIRLKNRRLKRIVVAIAMSIVSICSSHRAAFAQVVHIRSGGVAEEEGQGYMFMGSDDGDCYVVTVKHIVYKEEEEEVLDPITIRSDDAHDMQAEMRKAFRGSDIAVLQMNLGREDRVRVCGNHRWELPLNIDEIEDSDVRGELHFRYGGGGEEKIPVVMRFAHNGEIFIEPLMDIDSLHTGMSGAPLYVGNVLLGLFQSIVIPDSTENRKFGLVTRIDVIDRALGNWIPREPPGSVADSGRASPRTGFPWLIAGGGALLAGVAAAVLCFNGDWCGSDVDPCLGPTNLADTEPNNRPLPQTLTASSGSPVIIEGSVPADNGRTDHDYFLVQINSPGLYVSLTSLSGNADLYVGNHSGINLESNVTGTSDEIIEYGTAPPGIWAIDIYGVPPPGERDVGNIAYTLRVTGDIDGPCASTAYQPDVSSSLVASPDIWGGSAASFYGPADGCDATNCISLRKGWNTIRNMTDREYNWYDIRFQNDLSQNLWFYDGSWRADRLFRPGVTYHLYNDAEALHLRLRPFGSAFVEEPEADPVLVLTAFPEQGPGSSVRVRMASARPLRGYAPRQLAPPGEREALSLTLVEEALPVDQRYAKEVTMIAGEEGYRFTVALDAPPGMPVRMQLDGLVDLAGQTVYLVENESGRVHDFTALRSAYVVAAGATTLYTLLVGTPEYVRAQATTLRPHADAVTITPNPFVAGASITYVVRTSRPTVPVEVEVYNLLGQRVRVLVHATQPNGTFEVDWDGSDDAGDRLPGGVYLCRVRVDGASSTVKMTYVH
jgi:hypothetical protein